MKIAVIGMGRQGNRRAKELCKNPNVDGVIIYDVDSERVKVNPPNPDCPYYYVDSIFDAIDLCDAACICTPSTNHVEPALQCLYRHRPILIEKPLATTVTDARKILDTADSNGCPVHVGLNMRYRDPITYAKTVMPKLGHISEISARMGHSQFETEDDPRFKGSGGPLLDLGTHALDLCLILLNRPEKLRVSSHALATWTGGVTLRAGTRESDFEHETSIRIFTSYREKRAGVGLTINVIGSKGKMTINMGEPKDYVNFESEEGNVYTDKYNFPDDCWKLDCERFISCCRGGPSNSQEALQLVELLS